MLGMGGAAAAAVALKPDAASAADGGNMKLGMDNQTTSQTSITGGRNGGLFVSSTVDDGAVVGFNTAPDGSGLRGSGAIGVAAIGIGDGYAIHAAGRLDFSTSGRVTIAKGANKVVVQGVQGSMVLATLQGFQSGLSVAGVVLSGTTATIRLSKATTAPIDVAWFAMG